MNPQEKIIASTILDYLYKHKILGGVHTAFENLQKKFPKHLRGEANKIAKELIKDGFILAKPTNYGLQVSLNNNKLDEIERFIEEGLE